MNENPQEEAQASTASPIELLGSVAFYAKGLLDTHTSIPDNQRTILTAVWECGSGAFMGILDSESTGVIVGRTSNATRMAMHQINECDMGRWDDDYADAALAVLDHLSELGGPVADAAEDALEEAFGDLVRAAVA